MNNLQEKGRACYKRGEYKAAIEFFDRAIGHASSVQLLDNRAACYEKLNNLQAALKDAKKAIQVHREDATGYLRAGKVLVKMEKESVALEIYTHGLKCIKHVGQGYELLRKVHQDLMNKLCPPKSVDPMTVLPRELAEIILQHLTFRQRMNACLVSKQWTKFIRSCPDLWAHLDLSKPKKKVRNAFVSRAINVARTKLTKATLSNLWDFDKALTALVKHCPLEELNLREVGLVSNLMETLSPATNLSSLSMDSTAECPSEELDLLLLALSERLQTLSLSVTKPHTANGIFACVAGMPALRSLTIHDGAQGLYFVHLNNCRQLEYLDIKVPIPSAARIHLPTSLTVLKLRSTAVMSSSGFWFWPGPNGSEAITFDLPRLEELTLAIPNMIIHNVQHVLSGKNDESADGDAENNIAPSKLRKLSIIGSRLNYLQTSELFKNPRLGALELLHLPQLQSCCDEDVFGIVDALPNLSSLDLSENDITGIAIRRLVDKAHLRELFVNDCRKLGPDAVDLARQHGIKVQYRMSDAANGGRKVRS